MSGETGLGRGISGVIGGAE